MRVKDQLGFFYEIDIDNNRLWMRDKKKGPVLTFQDMTNYSWQRLEECISDEFWEWLPEQERWASKFYEPGYRSGASGGSIFWIGGASA